MSATTSNRTRISRLPDFAVALTRRGRLPLDTQRPCRLGVGAGAHRIASPTIKAHSVASPGSSANTQP